jgi:hypothetical protein
MCSDPPNIQRIEQQVFNIESREMFEAFAMDIFLFQYDRNDIYHRYCDLVQQTPLNTMEAANIPYLPISFFKTHSVYASTQKPEVIFESSGTTANLISRHLLKSLNLYERSFIKTFTRFYGSPEDYCIIALLPSYSERPHSSLIYMVEKLMQLSNHPLNGFHLYDFNKLAANISELNQSHQKILLIGVTYALLDFAESYPMHLKNTIIIETGGMKGRKKELIRDEVHQKLKQSFQGGAIHSEYGMTELMSQAYAKTEGKFICPSWMAISIREEDDPVNIVIPNQATATGAINVIDLANIYSCSFIATEDVGRLYPNGSFEVLGRLDNSDIRGCSLLML